MDSPTEVLKSIENFDDAHKQAVLQDYIQCLQTYLDAVRPAYDDLLRKMFERNERSTLSGQHIACIRRTSHDINNEQLYLAHRGIYDQLARDGKLVLSKANAKLITEDAPECITEKTSIYYTLKDDRP